ncbi:MAG TPA: LamG-like jellyroll fold domain-containing protein [Verrucomicrobiae bacterium]
MHTKRIAQITFGLAAALGLSAALSASAQTLAHRYSFNDSAGGSTFADSVGGADGTLNNATAGNANSASLDGSQLQLDGTGGFGVIPSGLISANVSVSIEFWASYGSTNQPWTRTFAFGDQTSDGGENTGLDYTHYAPGNFQNVNIQTAAGSAYANNPAGLNGSNNVHVTVVIDPTQNNMYYYNGSVVVSVVHGTIPPLSGINDTYGLIGRSLVNLDPALQGSINEFRIYSGDITPQQVAVDDATGPDQIVTNPGTVTSINFSSPVNSLVVNQTVLQVLTGNFSSGVTGVNMLTYGGATFTSLNPGVVTINANGVVKGISAGIGQVVATYGSYSATNTIQVIAPPTVLTHRYSFTSDASDSIGGANGTLMGDATVSGGQLVLDGSSGCFLDLPGADINIATNTSVTIEAWVTFNDPSTWAYLFGFGNTNNGAGVGQIGCVPCAQAGGYIHWGITENQSGGATVGWAHGWNNATMHITSVVDPTTGTISIYRDGVLEVTQGGANNPLSDTPTNWAYLGHSFYSADPYLSASIDEFRIYNGALTPAQVAMTQLSGPNSANFNPGALQSIVVVATNYPAFASLVPPVIFANYANLPNFNMLPTLTAGTYYGGLQPLTVTSSDPNIISVNAQNMLTTHRPGTVTLTATYAGFTSSAVVRVHNEAVLTHRYSFTSDASDSVGGANGSLQGAATISSGQLQLTGNTGDYLELPAGLLQGYNAVTVDAWVNLNSPNNWARLWEFNDGTFGNTENELYFSPGWNPDPTTANFYNAGFPWGNSVYTPGPLGNESVHLTCEYGDGWVEVYTNAILMGSIGGVVAPASSAGTNFSSIGYSPYGDPGVNGSVDEFRIYNGILAPEEIQASQVLGPNTALSTSAALSASRSGGNSVLSWPLASAGFALQTTTNILSNWTTLTNAPAISGTNWQLALPSSGKSAFYRLVR